MDSFMYSSSSKGIVSQALTGAGTEFKRLSEVLVNRHGALDSGVGRCYLAGLYNIAPWPIGDKKRALQEVLLSLGRHPGSRRNNYYACMMSLQAGEAAKAVSHCEAAMRARCIGPTEPDYCTFMTSAVLSTFKSCRAVLANATPSRSLHDLVAAGARRRAPPPASQGDTGQRLGICGGLWRRPRTSRCNPSAVAGPCRNRRFRFRDLAL
jgi:hypothetical protein